MKARTAVMLAIVVFFVSSVLVFLAYTKLYMIGYRVISADINVKNTSGFNLDNDALHFGGVSPGNSANRDVILTNPYEKTVKADITCSGELSEWINGCERSVYIASGANETVSFDVTVPPGTEYGNYTANITVIFKRF